jgi:hypothetical protein
MTKLKYTKIAEELKTSYGYSLALDGLENMPASFVLLIARYKDLPILLPEIRRIVKYIVERIDREITPRDLVSDVRGKELFDRGIYQKKRVEITMHKL